MFLLSLLLRQGTPHTPASSIKSHQKLGVNLSHEDDGSIDSNPTVNNTFETDAFQQQRFAAEYTTAAAESKDDFSSFIQKAATSMSLSFDDSVPGQAPSSSSSSFEKDYNDNKEVYDEWEDLPSPPPKEEIAQEESPSTPQKNHVHFAREESPQPLMEYQVEDSSISNETHFFSQNSMSHSKMHAKRTKDALDLQPRFQVDPIDEDIPFEDVPHGSFQPFLQDASIGPPEEEEAVRKCFDNVTLVSPEYFDTLKKATEKEKRREAREKRSRFENESVSSSLSTMVCAMDPELFVETPEEKQRRKERSVMSVSQASHCSGSSLTQAGSLDSILHLEEYTIQPETVKSDKKNRFESIRKKLSSSFRSKSKTTRVSYSLSKGLKGMSDKELVYSKSLLPAKPLLSLQQQRESSTSTPIPRSMPTFFRDKPLSVLLLNPVLKIFEIVLVDILRDTTIGDTLSKARASATDSDLSQQQYIGLCNRKKQELTAPMLPVYLLLPSRKSRRKYTAANTDGSAEQQPSDKDKRRDMENHLLVAVPKGSTAYECQKIRRMLWKNPRIQRWWQQSDPFSHPSTNSADEFVEDETLYEEPAPKMKKTRRRKEKRSKVPYQKL